MAPQVPPSVPSSHLGPAEEGGDLPDGDVARQGFDAQVAVVREEDHLAMKAHRPPV